MACMRPQHRPIIGHVPPSAIADITEVATSTMQTPFVYSKFLWIHIQLSIGKSGMQHDQLIRSDVLLAQGLSSYGMYLRRTH